jgi:YD repeat-containing protein
MGSKRPTEDRGRHAELLGRLPDREAPGTKLDGLVEIHDRSGTVAIATAAEPLLETESFGTQTAYDALNRPTSVTAPDASEVKPTYNEAGLLERVEARIPASSSRAGSRPSRRAPAWPRRSPARAGTRPRANHLLVKNYSVVGLYWGTYSRARPDLTRRAQDELYGQGAIKPLVSAAPPMAEAKAAMKAVASRATTGKMVLTTARGGGA